MGYVNTLNHTDPTAKVTDFLKPEDSWQLFSIRAPTRILGAQSGSRPEKPLILESVIEKIGDVDYLTRSRNPSNQSFGGSISHRSRRISGPTATDNSRVHAVTISTKIKEPAFC